ncbi:hypothetical protein P9112_013730 [Eukaryota sp. TZLM1-RC]
MFFFQFPSPSFTPCPLPIQLSQQFSLPLSLSVSTGPKHMLVSLLSTLSKPENFTTSCDAFKFLGCWLGNVPQIQNELQVILEKIKIALDSISSLDIEKLINFFMFKICYTGRITHILRSYAPSIALDFCRSFNSLRAEFIAALLDVEPGM